VLLLFILLFIGLAGNEDKIIIIQQHIDKYVGFDLQNNISNTADEDSTKRQFQARLQTMIVFMKEWIIKDYKSSQCRKWIRWINNKRRIIFSS